MAEQIQCPVCTLFLHAGMNLSDHLETHPKEQVIQALVQVTLCNSATDLKPPPNKTALTDEIADDRLDEKQNIQLSIKSTPAAPFGHAPPLSSEVTKTTDLTPLPNTPSSSRSSKSFAQIFEFPIKSTQALATITTEETNKNNSLSNKQSNNILPTTSKDNNGDIKVQTEINIENSKCAESGQLLQQNTKSCITSTETTKTSQKDFYLHADRHVSKTAYDVNNVTNGFPTVEAQRLSEMTAIQQKIIKPSPPSSSSKPHPIALHTVSSPSLLGLHSLTTTGQQSNQQHQHLNHHHHQHHQPKTGQSQNLKIIYTSSLASLGPPPPLQLFGYQHPQHQKPPPAYGTAISQIRSQNNQNSLNRTSNLQSLCATETASISTASIASASPVKKNKITANSDLLRSGRTAVVTQQTLPPPPLLQMQRTQKNQQSQILNQNHCQATQFSGKNASNFQDNIQQHNRSSHPQCGQNAVLSNAVLPPTDSESNIPSMIKDPFTTITQATASTVKESPTSATAEIMSGRAPPPIPPPLPPPPLQQSTSYQSIQHRPSVQFSSFVRQTSSPFPVGSPACSSSVLRYAESPVNVTAHYLERENGDFIVQETPKHVVECVEKDNGEFSVIERVYHSQPSVLQINDDHDECPTVRVAGGVDEGGDSDEFMSADDDGISQDEEESSKSLSIEENNELSRKARTPTIQSSKNSITVLSNVQLNLNEYLDLVGNIIASNKEVKNRSEFIKVEKFEPPDYDNATLFEDEMKFDPDNQTLKCSEMNEDTTDTTSPESTQRQVEEIKQRNQSNQMPKQQQQHRKDTQSPSCSSAVTSVIRMASNPSHKQDNKRLTDVNNEPQEKLTQPIQKEPSIVTLPEQITLHSQENFPPAAPSAASASLEVSISSFSTDITSLATSTKTCSNGSALSFESNDHQNKLFNKTRPIRKIPKKLVIKPKSKTAVVPISSSTTTTSHPTEVPSSSSSININLQDAVPLPAQEIQKVNNIKQELNSTQPLATIITSSVSDPAVNNNNKNNNESCSPEMKENPKENVLAIVLKKEKYSENNNENKDDVSEAKEEPSERIKTDSSSDNELSSLLQECMKKENVQDVLLDVPMQMPIVVCQSLGTSISDCSFSSTLAQHSSFPSASSVFSKPSAVEAATEAATTELKCNDITADLSGDNAADHITSNVNVQEIVSTSFSANSVDALSNEFANTTAAQMNANDAHHSSFSDYPFSFLYGGGGVANQLEGREPHFSPISIKSPVYEGDGVWRWNCVPSGSRSSCGDADDSHRNTSISATGSNTNIASVGTTVSNWYQQQQSQNANQDFEVVEGNGVCLGIVSNGSSGACGIGAGSSGGKYLDLDSYKRAGISSLCVVNETCSLATADSLNMRTDEKMPAKGEISEQESNCDVDNSWSQSLHGGEFRFFKTIPTLLNQENNWNADEYFHPQDLSATAKIKSFGLQSTVDGNQQEQQFLLQQQQNHLDSLPSTSKKKRKRDELPLKQNVTPETEFLPMGEGRGESASRQPQNSQIRKRIFQCVHCKVVFSKLKDRNSHMIVVHNYVRQNRRLVREQPTSTVTTATATTAAAANVTSTTATIATAATTDGGDGVGTFVMPFEQQELLLSESIIEDSKSSIIKVEINTDQQLENQDVKLLEFPIMESSIPAAFTNAATTAFTEPSKIFRKPNCTNNGSNTIKFISQRSSQYALLNAYNLAILQQNKKPNADEKPIDPNLFNCFVCKQSFSRVNLYDQHLLDHPAECYTCGKKFCRWKNFSLHLKRHMGWKKFACTVCSKKFVVRSALIEHQRIHNGQLPLKCLICGRHFRRYSNLTQHRKLHHSNRSANIRKKEYVCFCGEVLPSKARFNWHKETHDTKPKCCPHCFDRFVHSNSLRRHIRLAHSDKFDYTEPMECPMCKQVFAKSSIKAHMATHSMDTQQVCLICNKTFSTKWNLKIHNWVHANRTSKPFKCEFCVKAFVREVDFKNHMNAHKQIKPYTCEYCGCKFIRKYNYMRHRREHHGKKKFTCDLCKKSFHRHYYLIEHRRIHTGERPFQCTICGKSSTTKTNHNKHLKIHNSRDPFTVEA